MRDFAIILDLDGTLADTAPDLIDTADDILADMGAAPADPVKGRLAAGQGARRIIETALADQGRPLPGEDAWAEIIADFIARYQARIARRSRLFDGMAEFLSFCREAGYPLGVCTNKKSFLAEALLEALGARHFFQAVTGADTVGRGKPDPAPLLHCLSGCSGAPERGVLIGDSMADMLAARAAGATSILAGWGYLDRPEGHYQADFVIHDPMDAPPLIEELAARR